MKVLASGLSDVGRVRAHNEDSFFIDPDSCFFIVADGMGGHGHGEIASRIAVDAMRDSLQLSANRDMPLRALNGGADHAAAERLRSAVEAGHRKVLAAVEEEPSLAGMGTTVVGVLLSAGAAAIAHVGDSRVYRLAAGELSQLTEDHTWVNEQVAAGYLTEEQARSHPLKNVVTRALGGEPEVRVSLQEIELAVGDVVLLCSDGLSGMLSDAEIRKEMALGEGPDAICRNLVQAANRRGGHDNTTVIVIAFSEE